MHHAGVTPRLREAPHQRRKRGAALASAGNQSCVEVQWWFLPPRSAASSPGKLRLAADRSAAAAGGGEDDYLSYQDQRGPAEQSRVLDVLTGEAQRQAALDRIMAEMHDLVVQPLTPPKLREDAAPPAREARKRSSALLESFRLADGPGGGVSLLPQRKRSTLGIIADAHARSTDEDEDEDDGEARSSQGAGAADSVLARAAAATAASSAEPPRRRWKCADAADDLEPQFVWQQSATAKFAADLPRRLAPTAGLKTDGSPRPPGAATAASRPAAAPYGAWYVPRHHWWPLRQLEQQAAAATSTSDHDRDHAPSPPLPPSRGHCHRGAQRQHKPPLPPSAASPRAPSRSGRRPPPSPSSPSPLPPSSSSVSAFAGTASPQVQLADSYIGREYRSFITRRGGSPLPHYLA